MRDLRRREQLHARRLRVVAGRFDPKLGVHYRARDVSDAPRAPYADLSLGAPMLTWNRSSTRRRGASIIELMIALTIFGLVMAGVTGAIAEPTRFQAGASRVVASQRSLRQISDLLPSELRALGTGSGDIYAMNASSIDLRVTTGSTVVCAVAAGGGSVTIPPVQLATGVPLTSWRDVPTTGDSLFIFDEGAAAVRNDDSWRAYRLSVPPAAAQSCPIATGFTRTAGEAAQGMRLTVTPPIPATTQVGAPIRFFRPARYALGAQIGRAHD